MLNALGFLGLPSLHSIIEGIARGFFGAFAHALVPSWLTHGTVATIQHLVALPDPASWTHVGELQGDMVYLGAMLLPVTLAVGTVRYWLVGLTGAAHPVAGVSRSVWVTFVLVAYRWFVEQMVAATNTLTHAVLGFPVVASGLQRIVGVLFGGALLSGTGGVFGALLVIVGVLFAAGLFAAQVLLTVLLAVMIVAGPPLIALSAIPELSHLARTWAHALLAIALVPLGWTVLFATAGALCLDATSFTGGAGGVPGHVAAAFAGLITFAMAVRLPLMLPGELRHLFGAASSGASAAPAGGGAMPATERVRAARARLRTAALQGIPSLGASAGRAAGALGAPEGGPLGAARRGLAGAVRHGGMPPLAAAAAPGGGAAGRLATGLAAVAKRPGVRERLRSARVILANAPRQARSAVAASTSGATRFARTAVASRARNGASSSTGPAAVVSRAASKGGQGASSTAAGSRHPTSRRASPTAKSPSSSTPNPAQRAPGGVPRARKSQGASAHPGRRVQRNAAREATLGGPKPGTSRPHPQRPNKSPARPPAPPRSEHRDRRRLRRKPQPRSGA
jgi:hypothetical protein